MEKQDNQTQAEIEQNSQEILVGDFTTPLPAVETSKKNNGLWIVLGLALAVISILVIVWQVNTKEPVVLHPKDEFGGGVVVQRAQPTPTSVPNKAKGAVAGLINGELQGTVEFAVRKTQSETKTEIMISRKIEAELIAINETGTQTPIYRWEGNMNATNKPYMVVNDKVYIEDNSSRSFEECYLGMIDLTAGNGNYKLDKLIEFKHCSVAEFVIVGDNVYYIDGLREAKDIYSFNTKTNEEKLLMHAGGGAIFNLMASEQGQAIFYQGQMGQEISVFMYDLESNQTKQVCTECFAELVNDDKLVYYTTEKNETTGALSHIYYLYDVNTNVSDEFFTTTGSHHGSLGGYVFPFKREYFYLDYLRETNDQEMQYDHFTKVFKINTNLEKELVYSAQDFAAKSILWSGDNRIMLSESRPSLDGTILKTMEIDLNSGNISFHPGCYYHHPQFVSF